MRSNILFWIVVALLLIALALTLFGCNPAKTVRLKEAKRIAAAYAKTGELPAWAIKKDSSVPESKKAEQASWQAMHWVVLGGLAGVAVGVFLLLQGHKIALPVMGASITAMGFAIAISKFYNVFAYVGLGVAVLGMLGVMVLAYLRVRKSFGEVVWTAEMAKEKLNDKDKELVFKGGQELFNGGPNDESYRPSIADRAQNNFTQKLVKIERVKQGLTVPKE